MQNHLKITKWTVFFLMAIILYSCELSLSEIIDGYANNTGKVIKDTALIINTSNQDAEVSFDKFHIEISQGTMMDSARLTIKEYDPAEEEPVENFDYGPVYDVTIEGHDQFNPELIIKLDFDNTQVPEKFETGIFPMYYNDSLKKWDRFLKYSVDTAANQVEIVTNHLCKVSWLNPNRFLGYTDIFSNGLYNIYWKSGEIPSNSAYNSPRASLYTYSKNPHYVEDIGYYLRVARDVYQIDFPGAMPGLGYNIFITDLGEIEGQKDFITNSIYIDNSLTHNDLRSVCTHELLHLVQDNYYNMLASKITVAHWWLEALAINADLLVWKSGYYDAFNIPNNEFQSYKEFPDLTLNLTNSWDDCADNDAKYRAGCFLSYLSYYRKFLFEEGSQKHLSVHRLDSMMIYVGENGPLSSVSETLDEYLRSKGDTLGVLYDEFIRWAIGLDDEKQLWLTDQYNYYKNWQETNEVNNNQQSFSASQSIPSLGVRAFKVFNTFEPSDQVLVEVNGGPDVKTYFCGEKKDNRVFRRVSGPSKASLDITKPFTITMSGDDRCFDILCINQNNSSAQDASVIVKALFPFLSFRFRLEMNLASNEDWMEFYLDVSKWGGWQDSGIYIESRDQEDRTLKIVATLYENLHAVADAEKTTLELTFNDDFSILQKAVVHTFHPVTIDHVEQQATVDFTIENFPLSKSGNRYTKILGGHEAWSHLTHFSLKTNSRTESANDENSGVMEITIF